jgi:hypothetical protein
MASCYLNGICLLWVRIALVYSDWYVKVSNFFGNVEAGKLNIWLQILFSEMKLYAEIWDESQNAYLTVLECWLVFLQERFYVGYMYINDNYIVILF